MTDDWHNPRNPGQDCHSMEISEQDKKARKDFIEPANLGNVIWRAPEAATDPSCNQLSASRITMLVCAGCTVALTWAAIVFGKSEAVTGLVQTVAGIAAGVYFGSQFKDLRWKWRAKDD